jgi:hypothetical protein
VSDPVRLRLGAATIPLSREGWQWPLPTNARSHDALVRGIKGRDQRRRVPGARGSVGSTGSGEAAQDVLREATLLKWRNATALMCPLPIASPASVLRVTAARLIS